MIPENTVRLSGEEAIKNLEALRGTPEHDDVQGVYANLDTDEVLPLKLRLHGFPCELSFYHVLITLI